MRGLLIQAVGLIGLGMLGAMHPAFAGECRVDLNACVTGSQGHPHICDALVRNLPTCEANELKGIHQASVDPRLTKEGIYDLYGNKPKIVLKK